MPVEQALPAEMVDRGLDQRARVDVGQVLGDFQPVDQLRGGHDPAEAQPGEQDLGERPDIDDEARDVERLERSGRLRAEEQASVEAVLHDRQPMPRRHLEEPLPRLGAHREPGRVVGARLAVEQLRRLPLEQAVEMLGIEAAVPHGHRQELRPERAEDLHGARIGRLLDRDEVARIQQGPRDQVEALLRAVDDQDLLGADLEPEAQEVTGQELAQRRIATPRVVLQQLPAFLADHAVEDASEGIGGKEPAVGHAARERDRARPGLGHLAIPAPPTAVGRDHLGALGEKWSPVESRRRGPCDAGARGDAIGDERPLAYVRPGPAARHQLVVGQGDCRAIDPQLTGQLAARGELHPGPEQALADQPLEVELDLARQRCPPSPPGAPVQLNSHGLSIIHYLGVWVPVNLQLDDSKIIQSCTSRSSDIMAPPGSLGLPRG